MEADPDSGCSKNWVLRVCSQGSTASASPMHGQEVLQPEIFGLPLLSIGLILHDKYSAVIMQITAVVF